MVKQIVINEKNALRFNCVKYARSMVKSLPFGLWTIKDKEKIINDKKSKIGSVAIMNVGMPWGHLGVVVDKTGKGQFKTIREANYKLGKITERTGTSAELKILGYFNPQK